ncbi:MAG: alpha/beta hydrolase [Sideroxydans sp.]
MSEPLPHIVLQTGAAPRHSLIWLHGLGADGHDFVPVVDELHLPCPVRYLFPHAPQRPVTLNGGFVMRAWYDIESADLAARPDRAGILASQRAIEKLILQEQASGIPAANIFLAGFSQGGAIALQIATHSRLQLGGVVALSTYLPLPHDTPPAQAAPPIFMAHGHHDSVVPPTLGAASARLLQAKGYAVDWREYPMAHAVCAQELRDIECWLGERMKTAATAPE